MNDMTCGQARRLAWDDPQGIVLPVERVRAQAHIARCPGCQAFLAAMRLFRGVVRGARGAEPAPLPLRSRIHEALGTAHRRDAVRRRWTRVGLGLAASLVLAMAGLRFLPTASDDPVLRIAGHERQLLTQAGIESSDPGAVHAWLSARFTPDLHIPTFLDARLTGAAVASIRGERVAVVRFQVGDRHVAYVVAPESTALGDATFRRQLAGDLAIVSWRMPGLLHIWIGPIAPDDLLSLARRCAQQARAAVSAAAFRHSPRMG